MVRIAGDADEVPEWASSAKDELGPGGDRAQQHACRRRSVTVEFPRRGLVAGMGEGDAPHGARRGQRSSATADLQERNRAVRARWYRHRRRHAGCQRHNRPIRHGGPRVWKSPLNHGIASATVSGLLIALVLAVGVARLRPRRCLALEKGGDAALTIGMCHGNLGG